MPFFYYFGFIFIFISFKLASLIYNISSKAINCHIFTQSSEKLWHSFIFNFLLINISSKFESDNLIDVVSLGIILLDGQACMLPSGVIKNRLSPAKQLLI